MKPKVSKIDPDGTVIVVWYSENGYDIYARRITAQRYAYETDFSVNTRHFVDQGAHKQRSPLSLG